MWMDSASDWTWISTMAGSGFDVALRLVEGVDMSPSPGQDVEFRVHVTHRGDPVDPDPDTLLVGYLDPAENEHELEVTRVGTGLFEGTLTVPASLKESSVYEMMADAEYTPDGITLSGDDYEDIYVQFFNVWAHITDVTPSAASVDIYALDLDGTVVEGATVDVDWVYEDDAWEDVEDSASGVTGSDGKASFSIQYTDLGKDAWNVEVSGRVTHGGFTQLYEGSIGVREDTDIGGPYGDGFEVEILNPGPYEGGESITVEHAVTVDGEPLADTEIFFYLTDDHKIYRFGSETTDAEGKFDFPLNLPQMGEEEMMRYVTGQYHMPGEFYWDGAYSWLIIGDLTVESLFDEWIDPGVDMDVPAFSAGETVDVTLDHADADGVEEQAMLIWGIGPLPDDIESILNLEWEAWNPGEIGFLQMIPMEFDDGEYVGSFSCPEFLTTDDELFMYGIIVFLEEGDDFESAKAAKVGSVNPVPPNPPPGAAITDPVEAEAIGGKIKIKGTSSDDTDVVMVEVSIDGGAWEEADGTTSWTFEVDTSNWDEGNHTVEVRSFDGEKYSDPVAVTFEVDHDKAPKEDESPGFGVTLMLLSMLGAALVARRRR
jgi:PGF-CTERM protein